LYVPLTLEEAVFQTKEVVKVFEEADVKILRVGLHPSEGLLSGESLVAGPFHPAFGEMVESALWKDILQDKLAGFLPDKLAKNPKLLLEVAAGQLNAAVGHRSSNKNFLKSVFVRLFTGRIRRYTAEIVNSFLMAMNTAKRG
jgi:hypothetical protein